MKQFTIRSTTVLASITLALASARMLPTSRAHAASSSLPVKEIENVVGAQGEVSHGVLNISIARDDIGDVQGPKGVTLTAAFEIHGDLWFQPLSNGRALLNGDMALTESEVNPFISALLDNGLVFQAFHQHAPTDPQVWFVHYRGTGKPIDLARAIRAAIDVTATQLPQTSPSKPTSPLDDKKLASILHGDAQIGEEGVVTVTVSRKGTVHLDGVHVSPDAGISTTIEFKPVGGTQAQVVADFSMSASEVDPVVHQMLGGEDWYQGCLYNQETDERPQLYFDHMIKSGDAYDLAKQIRRGLDKTDAD